jgi:hypothetical protein
MSKFTKIIQNTFSQLNETNADGTDSASPYNGGNPVKSTQNKTQTPNSTENGSGVADPNNPLHTAFDKIKQNPNNPALSANEHEALQGLAKTLDAAKNNSDQESPEEKKEANASGGQQENTVVSGAETYKSSTPGYTG